MSRKLSPIRKTATIRRFLVYDLEWEPKSYKLRLVGVYDGERYRYYLSIATFLESELNSENRGCWFYAHAGGLADIQFVFEVLLQKKGWEVDAKFSGSSAVIVKVKRGKNCYFFVDSYWLLRESLRKIGAWVGIAKGGDDGDLSIFYGPFEKLLPYNETDCEILWKAIASFQSNVLELGGQLQMTLASTAMMLFRRKYLDETIPTSNRLNRTARRAYFASRVEVFRRTCGKAYLYDINSSFPYAMTFSAPGRCTGSQRKLPKKGNLYLADVCVKVPEIHLPPLPYRAYEKGKVYFPVGEWRGWFLGVDIDLLLATGGEITEVHEVKTFEPFDGLRAYAEDLYSKRLAAKDDAEKIVYKLLLNSLYGKFAESTRKQSLLLHPRYTTCRHTPGCVDDAGDPDACLEQLMPGVWLQTEEKHIPHCHVILSAHITAIARRSLYHFLQEAVDKRAKKGLGPDVAYCDTDSLVTAETLDTGEGLGALKLEQTLSKGRFLQPKVYRADIEGQDPKVRIKGFSRVTADDFDALADGWSVGIERMTRVKEIFRSQDLRPRDREYWKRFRSNPDGSPVERSKRCFLPDGTTRPWHVDEIDE